MRPVGLFSRAARSGGDGIWTWAGEKHVNTRCTCMWSRTIPFPSDRKNPKHDLMPDVFSQASSPCQQDRANTIWSVSVRDFWEYILAVL